MEKPQIVELQNEIWAVGLSARINMKNIYQELSNVYKAFTKIKHLIQQKKTPWEYVSLSKNMDENQSWDYYTGYVVNSLVGQDDSLHKFSIPRGTYAVFPIRCKFKFLLGMKMGKTKRYIYNQWLPVSGYAFSGFEFEYNNEEMNRKSPYDIDLYVGLTQTS